MYFSNFKLNLKIFYLIKVENNKNENIENKTNKDAEFLYDPAKFAISDKDWVKIQIKNDAYHLNNLPNATYFLNDPYKYIWENNPKMFLGRFYLDINNDKIPELFLSVGGGTGGTGFEVFTINKHGYTYVGYIFFDTLKVLPDKHNGFNDLLVFIRGGNIGEGIGDIGKLEIYMYDNKEYNIVKEINHEVSRIEADKYMINYIHHSLVEMHPYDFRNEEKNKLIWKPEDDNKYRKDK